MNKQVMQQALLSCPCCGAVAVQHRDNNTFAGQVYHDRYPEPVCRQHHGCQVRCALCGIQTCWWHYESEAIEKWNLRAAIADEGEQEPVAWMRTSPEKMIGISVSVSETEKHNIPLYTSPPAPKPLSDERIIEIAKETRTAEPSSHGGHFLPVSFARAIAQAIAEKG